MDALALAILFHETYERLAPSFGYATRDDTKKFDPTTPNGKLMVAVCAEILASQQAQQSVQPTVSPVGAQAQSDTNPSELDRPASGG